jgi:hypothetical protein
MGIVEHRCSRRILGRPDRHRPAGPGFESGSPRLSPPAPPCRNRRRILSDPRDRRRLNGAARFLQWAANAVKSGATGGSISAEVSINRYLRGRRGDGDPHARPADVAAAATRRDRPQRRLRRKRPGPCTHAPRFREVLASLRGAKRRSNLDPNPRCRSRLLRFARDDSLDVETRSIV